MGCTTSVNKPEYQPLEGESESSRIIRLDLQLSKTAATPKNEIALQKMTEELLKAIEVLCGQSPGGSAKFETYKEQIINNSAKLEQKLDEVTYLLQTAREHKASFSEGGVILQISTDIVKHMSKMLEMNRAEFAESDHWYSRYALVLLTEISELAPIVCSINESTELRDSFLTSKEIVTLYACVIGIIRFLEGISWGYSVFLMHQQLDEDMQLSMKVVFNLLLRLKQQFRESKDFAAAFTHADRPAVYFSEHHYLNILSYSQYEKMLFNSASDSGQAKEDKRGRNCLYLQNLVFRKTYVQVKKQIDDWLRKVAPQEISVAELRRVKSVKSFSRSTLRELKNPRKCASVRSSIISSVSKSMQAPLLEEDLPTFRIDNTRNIMVIAGDDERDAKVIVESFLQANVKIRTKYKCSVLHHCLRENQLTLDLYYIVKNIIFNIVRTVPAIKAYLSLQEHQYFKEMLSSFMGQKAEMAAHIQCEDSLPILQREYADIFIKFCKVLKEVKLDFNVGVFITGIENLYTKVDQSRLDSFILLLRSCSIYFPDYLKFVLTIERRPSRNPLIERSMALLATKTIVEVRDKEVFEAEGASYLEFALSYGSGSNPRSQTPDALRTQTPEKQEVSNEVQANLELCLGRCKGSYRKGVEIIAGIHKRGIHPKDSKQIREFIAAYSWKEDTFKQIIKECLALDSMLAINFLSFLAYLKGPIHLETFIAMLSQPKSSQQTIDKIKALIGIASRGIVNIYHSKAGSFQSYPSLGHPIEEFIKLQKTIISPRRRGLFKHALRELGVELNKGLIHERMLALHQKRIEAAECEYEDLDQYHKLHVYRHLGKLSTLPRIFGHLDNILSVKNIYKQILYHKSYTRFRQQLLYLVTGASQSDAAKEDKLVLVQFANILCLIEQTISGEPLNFLDFCTQLRGRILGDQLSSRFMTELRLNLTSENICYFRNFHHALRENPRIDTVFKLPRCQVLRVKFFADKKRVVFSLSSGLLMVYSMGDSQVQQLLVSSHAVLDSLKLVEDKYLITAGIDPKVRIWNLETEKVISKLAIHPYATVFLLCHKEFIFSYGGTDSRLAKYNFKAKALEASHQVEGRMTALKLLKTQDGAKNRLAAAFLTGDFVLYDVASLAQLQVTGVKSVNEEVIQLINLSATQFLAFTKEGSISILNNASLEEEKAGSIFNLKSEDYIELILIKSREYFLFTLERQKLEFYSASSFKKTDSWDYFFERDLICCDKNKEGSKIFVSDKSGYTVMFNFLKHLDSSKENLVPCNRRYDPVICIDVTERLPEGDHIISCSQDRDLRIWRRDNGVFVKKYDLSSFTGENITSMKLGKDENMLFLGSKDMNVYLIDIAKGKLCVVYEGHWNRVTEIYIIPEKDVLVTVSESNVKVWDLEYDECIKNMNEHDSSIVYIAQTDNSMIRTIGQAFECKTWNYVTGQIAASSTFDLGRPLSHIVCCDVLDDLAFIALSCNTVAVFSIADNRALYSFPAYNDEQVIYLKGVRTEHACYLVVVSRTACIMYLVQREAQAKRVCSYIVNARKKPAKKKNDNKYSYNVRYYFTSARATLVSRPDKPGDDYDQVNTTAVTRGDEEALGKRAEQDTVVLVCLGDSRGFVHMNHLILK